MVPLQAPSAAQPTAATPARLPSYELLVVSPDGDEWTLDCATSFAMWARQHPGNLRIQEACDWDSIHALARLTATVCGDREVEVMRDAQAYR